MKKIFNQEHEPRGKPWKHHHGKLRGIEPLPSRPPKRTRRRIKLKIKRGFVLVTSLLVMMILLLMTTYLINFSISESKISSSQALGVQDYYLAEAGIQEAIWHLQYDNNWKEQFETNPSWSFSFTRNNNLINKGSYTIKIQNTALASGQITSTSTLAGSRQTSQRVVKIKAFKALNPNPLGATMAYSNGNLDISDSVLNINGGDLYSNGNIDLKSTSTVNLNSQRLATSQNVNKSCSSQINNASQIQAARCNTPGSCPGFNPPCSAAAPEAQLPMVDFDSNDPTSYKNRANLVYTENEFADLIWDNVNLTINDPIVYVTGDVDFNGPRNITINGVLVADGKIELGQELCLKRGPIGQWKCGNPSLAINRPPSGAAGWLAKKKINIGSFTSSASPININGLVYSLDQINISSLANAFNLVGGLYSRKVSASSLWQGLNLTYDPETVVLTLAYPAFSPTVTVEHWEEEY